MKLTDTFINSVLALCKAEPSKEDALQVRRCLIDYLGVTFAGSQMLGEKALKYADLLLSKGSCRVVGQTGCFSPERAAFLNGLLAHAAELDDGDRYGMFHPGAPLFSALLVLSQLENIPEVRFYRAVLAGYEASMLTARCMQPFIKEKGFHGTGIAGTVGAAMACSVALGAEREELQASLSAACTSAAGLLKVIKGKSEMKPLNVAYAAQNGLQAALMAKAGFIGSEDVLDGELGFFHAFSSKQNLSVIEQAGTASNPLIHSIYVKPYAACRHCHAPIEAALNLTQKAGFNSEAISVIEVSTYSWAIKGHDHTKITGINSAKMSIPYSVAAALLFRKGDIDVFAEPYLSDKALLSLTEKVLVTEDESMTRKAPGERGAEVKIKVKAEGKVLRYFVALPKGEPENPVSDEEILLKMKSLCHFAGAGESRISRMGDLLNALPSDSQQLNQLLYPF